MNKLSVDIKLVSPAFIGGADLKRAELRVASLRGLLRFWWRATQPPISTAKLLEKENELFGGTDTGQSKFLLQISEDETEAVPRKKLKPGANYLGYGLDASRTALRPGGEFSLRFVFKKDAERYKNGLLNAIWALSHLGGMGSRSRRGFGSAVVTGVEGADFPALPHSYEELKERIEEKFRELKIRERDDLPDYTALSRHAVVVVWPVGTKSWEQALQEVGDRLNAYRSSQREERFLDDRDLMRDYALRGREPHSAPRRAAFGLPHNYFFKQTSTQVNVNWAEHDRRASPLFIHLHELRGGELVAVLSLIPARFLPEGAEVKIGPAGRHGPQYVPPPPDFEPIRGFLFELPDALEVRI